MFVKNLSCFQVKDELLDVITDCSDILRLDHVGELPKDRCQKLGIEAKHQDLSPG